jgi:hypothetical protein
MISIKDLYTEIQGRVNSHQNGHLKPSDFENWVHESQMELFNDLVQLFQKTQQISDLITPFLTTEKIPITSQKGTFYDIVQTPKEYENFATARVIKSKLSEKNDGECQQLKDLDEIELIQKEKEKQLISIPIDLVDNDRFDSIHKHPRKGASADKPKMTQFTGGFKILPKSTFLFIEIDFFKSPIKPKYNFTVINPGSENEYKQFNPIGSQDINWTEKAKPQIIPKIIEKFAIFTGNLELLKSITKQ